MTTEIAVINRIGVALAADSAVTISGFGVRKVFNSGDKLFELSCHHPIGVMVNGNLDFLGVPWEIIIKGFRDTEGASSRDNVAGWTKALVDWVESHAAVNESTEQDWLFNFINDEMQRIADLVLEDIRQAQNVSDDLIDEAFKSRVEEALETAQLTDALDSLERCSLDQIRAAVEPIAMEIMQRHFQPDRPSMDVRQTLISAICEQLLRERWSSGRTGIVVAGFAGKDLFPSIMSITVDGIVCGRLRYAVDQHVEISRKLDDGHLPRRVLGTALSFAQTDVIERLLRGVDSRFVYNTGNFISSAIKRSFDELSKELSFQLQAPDGSPIAADRFFEYLAETVSAEFRTQEVMRISGEIERDFNQTIAVMPKVELIELAEALVNITAIERKASTDQETVGGPIDVALITRSEGFVWVKRKHHFTAALNPRYMQRVGRRMAGPEERAHGTTLPDGFTIDDPS